MPHKDESWELSHNWEKIPPLPTTELTSLAYVVGVGSDLGKQKKLNEDSLFAAQSIGDRDTLPLSFGLFVLADGMGAYADGQDASSSAIQTMVDFIWPQVVRSTTFRPEGWVTLLAEAVQLANEVVYQQNIPLQARDVDFSVMTTVTAAMVVGSTAYVANVGDSRTYLYRASEGLKKVTTDHLWVARQIEAGILKPDDLYTHPHRNVIERVLGWKLPVEVDLFTVQLHPGDTVLLCSDGLWNMVRDSKIEDILCHTLPDPSQAAEALIQSALNGGGKDNVSVIVVSMLEASNQTLVPSVQFFARPNSLHTPQA